MHHSDFVKFPFIKNLERTVPGGPVTPCGPGGPRGPWKPINFLSVSAQ